MEGFVLFIERDIFVSEIKIKKIRVDIGSSVVCSGFNIVGNKY